MNEREIKTYGRAYRAAFAHTREDYDDERHAKDAAHTIANIAMSVKEGRLDRSGIKLLDPATEAALKAVRA
jgi:hypothetical protein